MVNSANPHECEVPTACKAVYLGSIPGSASKKTLFKSSGWCFWPAKYFCGLQGIVWFFGFATKNVNHLGQKYRQLIHSCHEPIRNRQHHSAWARPSFLPSSTCWTLRFRRKASPTAFQQQLTTNCFGAVVGSLKCLQRTQAGLALSAIMYRQITARVRRCSRVLHVDLRNIPMWLVRTKQAKRPR